MRLLKPLKSWKKVELLEERDQGRSRMVAEVTEQAELDEVGMRMARG